MNRSRLAVLLVASALVPAVSVPGAVAQEPVSPPGDHTVVDGNTLWGLAQRYYGDPWAWPTIFDANRGLVASPDLIYPGTVLVIPAQAGPDRRPPPMRTDEEPGQVAPADVGAIAIRGGERVDVPPRETSVYADPRGRTAFYQDAGGGVQGGQGMARTPLRAIPPQIAHGAPFAVPTGTEMPRLGVLAPPSGVVAAGDLLYSARVYDRMVLALDEGRRPPSAGTRLQVFRIVRDDAAVGRIARVTGVVEVEGMSGDEVRVEVLEQYDRMAEGDMVRLLPADPTDALAETRPVSGGGAYRIAAVEDTQPVQGPGDWVFVDTREAGALRAGDELVVEADPALPPLARLQVVGLYEGIATLRIVALRDVAVEEGAPLRLDRRLR